MDLPGRVVRFKYLEQRGGGFLIGLPSKDAIEYLCEIGAAERTYFRVWKFWRWLLSDSKNWFKELMRP